MTLAAVAAVACDGEVVMGANRMLSENEKAKVALKRAII